MATNRIGKEETSTPSALDYYRNNPENHPGAEGGLNALDPKLAIKWPLDVAILSERDGSHPMLTNEFVGFLEAQVYAKHH